MRLKLSFLLLGALMVMPAMASTILVYDESGKGALNPTIDPTSGALISPCASTGTDGCIYAVPANLINGGQLLMLEPDIPDVFTGEPTVGDVITFFPGNPGALAFASTNAFGFTDPADTASQPPDVPPQVSLLEVGGVIPYFPGSSNPQVNPLVLTPVDGFVTYSPGPSDPGYALDLFGDAVTYEFISDAGAAPAPEPGTLLLLGTGLLALGRATKRMVA